MQFPPELVESLRTAQRVAALTGAGISAESGVPTFRDAQTGLWARFRPEELATPQAFQRDPQLVWEWYQWRRKLVADAQPNPGHRALAEMERLIPGFTLITQNVDNLHQRAGSQTVIELHGNLGRTKCFDEGRVVESWRETGQTPPRCPHCGGLLRPDVVWFGENLSPENIQAAQRAAQESQVFLSIGTSSLVQPAASLPVIALQAGALFVEINPQKTPLSSLANYVLRRPSGEALPELVQAVWGE